MAKKIHRRTVEELIAEAKRTRATRLDLSGMELTALPEAISDLPALRELYLWDNKLKTLPHAVGKLTGLRILYLAIN